MKDKVAQKEQLHLEYILETTEALQPYLHRKDAYEIFIDDWLTQLVVLRAMHTIAESTMHLSDELKRQHHHIPWDKIAG